MSPRPVQPKGWRAEGDEKVRNEGKWTIITIPGSLYKEAKKWAELWGCTAEEFIIKSIKLAIEEEKMKRGK